MVGMTVRYPWKDTQLSSDTNLIAVVSSSVYAICAEWLNVCAYFEEMVNDFEQTFEVARRTDSASPQIEGFLIRLGMWRAQLPRFKRMVVKMLKQALPTAVRVTTTGTHETTKDVSSRSYLTSKVLSIP
jgi:hypothetical protein